MSKKFNNKTLLIIFAVLLAVWLLTRLLNTGKNERNFRTELLELDTAQLTSVLLYPQADTAAVRLTKKEGKWQVQKGKVSAQADPQAADRLLQALTHLEPQRLASRSPEKWKAYEVTDSLATRVQIMQEGEVVAELLVGRLSFQQMASQQQMPMQQARPQATAYVRIAGEDEVYAVDGMQAMVFTRPFDSWRDRTFLALEEGNISSISFTYPADSGFVAAKADSIWKVDDTPADSARMARFLDRLAALNTTAFADDFSAEGRQPLFKAVIAGNNMEAVTVEGYAADSTFVLKNSQRPGVFARSDSAGLFSQVFVGKEALLQEEEEL